MSMNEIKTLYARRPITTAILNNSKDPKSIKDLIESEAKCQLGA